MHLGWNLTYLAPGETGGSETYARSLVPAVRAVRPDWPMTAFAAPELAGELRDAPWCAGLDVVRVPVPATTRVRRVLGEQTLLPLAAQRAGIDVLHSLASTQPLLTPGVTSILTVLDVIYATIPDTHPGLLTRGMQVIVPRSAKAADRVVTISEFVKDEVVRVIGLDPDRVDAVPLGPGLDPGPATGAQEVRARHGLGVRPLVLSVSARRAHKNLERLIDAMAAVPNATLVLPGYPGPEDDALREHAASAGLADRVKMLGWVSDEDLEGLYAAATCLAFPSLAEGFGLPVLEAMRRGLPVACSATTSLPEVAGDAALLFDPMSTDAIADAVRRLVADDALRERLRAAGLERAAQFSWEGTAHGTIAAYERALAPA